MNAGISQDRADLARRADVVVVVAQHREDRQLQPSNLAGQYARLRGSPAMGQVVGQQQRVDIGRGRLQVRPEPARRVGGEVDIAGVDTWPRAVTSWPRTSTETCGSLTLGSVASACRSRAVRWCPASASAGCGACSTCLSRLSS